jgi:hypothetical protein
MLKEIICKRKTLTGYKSKPLGVIKKPGLEAGRG